MRNYWPKFCPVLSCYKPSLMKRLLCLLLATALAAIAATVDSKITAVTVYTDRAVITRTASAVLPTGITELVFAGLPQALDERSLQVSGQGIAPVTILDVSARPTHVDFAANPRVKELEEQLRHLQRELRGLEDEGAGLVAQGATLDRMEGAFFAPPVKENARPELDRFSSYLAYLTEQRERLASARRALDGKNEDTRTRLATVQRQLNELRGAGNRAFKTVTVRVAAETAGPLDLTLGYTVGGASWTPGYDVRVTAGESTVSFGYFGLVRQNTGEDWTNVALTLSTARPALGGAAPSLDPWSLDIYDEARARLEAMAAREREMSQRKMTVAPAAMMSGSGAPLRMDAYVAEATVDAGTTSATFRIAAPSTIASDNSTQKVPVTTARLAAELVYQTTPKRMATAYLSAAVRNSSDFPLLAGAMNVFLDGTFVATSRLETVMPGEKFDLALGADEGIALEHKRVQKFTEQTGLISRSTRITYEYLISVQNNKRTPVRVVVTDQVPLARNEKITVRVQAPPDREVQPDADGLLKWTLDLAPGAKRELTVKFTVDHPNDVNVIGLE